MSLLPLPLAALVLLAACADDASDAPSVALWELADEPERSVGTLDGAETEELFRVQAARLLSDGTLALANAGTLEIRFFDEDGAFLHEVGGGGEGPGEFGNLGHIARLPGDTVVALDRSLHRMTVVDSEGSVADTWRVEPPENGSAAPWSVHPLGDGLLGIVTRRQSTPAVPPGVIRPLAFVGVYRTDGEVLLEWAELGPGLEGYRLEEPNTLLARRPFGRNLHVTGGPDGLLAGTADDGGIISLEPVVEGDALRLERDTLRLPLEPDPVTDEEVEAWKEAQLENAREADREAFQREVNEAVTFPAEHPAYLGLERGPDGSVWVRERATGREGRRWRIFERDGSERARLVLPSDARLLEVADGAVLLRRTDELDVERVELRRLVTADEGEP